ncbi:MAG: hypothetical protein JNJ58_04580 [Chitinophagaceae bacterium]|nr:hypothetical protein [Chitinophagaceae bacterium]
MRKLIPLFLLIFLSCDSYSQGKKTQNFIGFQTGVSALALKNTPNHKSLNLGLPSFSYGAVLENRLEIHNELHFSLQYSLSYMQFNQRVLDETQSILQKSSTGQVAFDLSANTIYKPAKQIGFVAGLGINKPLYTFNNSKKIPLANESHSQGDRYTLTNFKMINPYLIFGFENCAKIFNRNIYISLQYQLGFLPYQIPGQSSQGCQQGIRIGLKYKY